MIRQFCTSTEIGYDMEAMTERLRAARIIPLTAKMSSNDDKAALLRVVAHELFIKYKQLSVT